MQHCSGDEQQGYISGIKDKELELWSLRDSNNEPHCTVEYEVGEKEIKQIKGKNNKGIIPKYVPYVREFLELQQKEKKISKFNKHDLTQSGILVQKGIWYNVYRLPENFTVLGDLRLFDMNKYVTYLPKGLYIRGSAYFNGIKITELPEDFKVQRDINLSNSEIKELPDNFKVNGYLDLKKSKIIKLPENLNVRGDLDISDTELVELPKGLNIMRSLFMEKTNIKEIPKGIKIGGDLNLRNTKVTTLPDRFTVHNLYLNSLMESLPDNLTVDLLDLSGSKIQKLPKGLTVRKLNIVNTAISELPKDLVLLEGGVIVLTKKQIPDIDNKWKNNLTFINRPIKIGF